MRWRAVSQFMKTSWPLPRGDVLAAVEVLGRRRLGQAGPGRERKSIYAHSGLQRNGGVNDRSQSHLQAWSTLGPAMLFPPQELVAAGTFTPLPNSSSVSGNLKSAGMRAPLEDWIFECCAFPKRRVAVTQKRAGAEEASNPGGPVGFSSQAHPASVPSQATLLPSSPGRSPSPPSLTW